jgi:hypothetical protein
MRPRVDNHQASPRGPSTEEEALPRPSVALYDPHDREETALSGIALRAARAVLDEAQGAYPVQLVVLESGDLVVLEIHGQSSVTGHGNQGLRPTRIALLRRLHDDHGLPSYLIFVEGHKVWRRSWLHDLPAAKPISHGLDGDPDSKRYGWSVAEMERVEGEIVLPDRVSYAEREQGSLLGGAA